jgi:iduronate 2-sulfatase
MFLGLLVSSTASAAPRPNVLFLIADDLNNYLGCYGDPLAKTPNLDKLAARGVRFDRAYCTFPLCGPSRNSMLTGLYPNSTGIQANALIFRQTIPEQLSLPQAFRLSGYFAARIGKLYHYNVPNSIGTDGHDDPASWELEWNPAGVDRMEEHPKIFSLVPNQFGGTLSWLASEHPDSKHTDAMMADCADKVMELAARDSRPFFLSVGFFRPHTPYVAPKEPYFGYYPLDKMPIVEGVKEDQVDIPSAAIMNSKKVEQDMTDRLRREAMQAYYASITFLDTQVGRVIDSLDRLKLSDNTIIVFTSDHGYHMGEHGLYQKQSLFEGSSRVPLFIVAPGVSKPSQVAASPISQVDLFPTLAELCGVTKPTNLQGQSLVSILKDASQEGRGWAVTQLLRTENKKDSSFFGYSLRTERWRYTEWDDGKKGRELYDHDHDPKELTNLADDPMYQADVESLKKHLHQAVASTMPASGSIPEVKPGVWPPILIAP